MRRRRLTPPPPPPTPTTAANAAQHVRVRLARPLRSRETAAAGRRSSRRARRRGALPPSPGSTVSSSSSDDDGRHQGPLSPPLGTPAPESEDGGSNNLTRAVLSLSLSGAGLTNVKARSSATRAAVSSDHQDDGTGENKPTHARFLVSHAEARLIIGTGGSTVVAIEARSGARIKLSRHDQLLSGTDRRVVLVSGTFSQVMDAMELLLEKLLNQGDRAIDSQYTTVVLVVPQACCGQLIGKGGPVIRSLTEVSEAEIQVSPKDTCYGSNDSLVSIRGPLDNQLQELFLILFMLLENFNYTFTYAAPMVSGAWITISPKGEFMPGTCDREVIITGTSEAIRAAEAMIMRRVSVASGKGDDELTWRRVEGRGCKGGEIKSRLDEQADDAVLQMRRLQLSDGSDTE